MDIFKVVRSRLNISIIDYSNISIYSNEIYIRCDGFSIAITKNNITIMGNPDMDIINELLIPKFSYQHCMLEKIEYYIPGFYPSSIYYPCVFVKPYIDDTLYGKYVKLHKSKYALYVYTDYRNHIIYNEDVNPDDIYIILIVIKSIKYNKLINLLNKFKEKYYNSRIYCLAEVPNREKPDVCPDDLTGNSYLEYKDNLLNIITFQQLISDMREIVLKINI